MFVAGYFLRRIFIIFLATGLIAITAQGQGTGYWHTSGSQILDANNQPVRIAGINWYGFETDTAVAGGLSDQDYRSILQTIQTQGYNTVRIPFSNQMVETPTPSSGLNISYYHGFGAINTDLQGLNSLQVLDKIISYAGTLGLKVILDNHRSEAGNSAEASGLWYTGSYPESAWIADWTMLANRYLGNTTVIGFDLRNEPHNAASGGACWDCGSAANDWHLAAARGGNAVLAVNPRLLIFVEGTDSYNNDYYWWGGNLEGVANSPVTLSVANQLVYSAHDYGPHEYQQNWFNGSTTYASLSAVWTQHWAYICQAGTAPVWLGEFGTTNTDSDVQNTAAGSQGQWFSSLVTFLGANKKLNWTYWALNGEDSYGLLDQYYDATPADALKQSTLATIQSPFAATTPVAGVPAAASGLTATSVSTSQINLAWLASPTTGAAYTIYFGTSATSITTVLASGLAGTSYQATNLNPSVTYFFNVVATNSTGASTPSNTASATTQAVAAPAAPTALIATAISSSQSNLSWSASATAGVTYSVYSGSSASNISALVASAMTGTSFQQTGLQASTTYFYAVKAVAGTSASPSSNQASATTQAASAPVPSAPSGLSASPSSASQINLQWQPTSTSGATYSIYEGTTSGVTSSLVASGLTSTNFAATGLADGTTYFFVVKAATAAGVSPASNQASATTQTAPATAPTGVSASAASSTQINLSWNAVSNTGATYSVYFGTSSGATNTLIASGISGTTYQAINLTASTTYYFTVRSVSPGGTSSPSNQASATTLGAAAPAAPTGLTATAVSISQINLAWSASSAGATYTIFYGLTSGAATTRLASGVTGTTYQSTGLAAGTTYFYTVSAVSAAGTSGSSNQASATTQAAVITPPAPVTPTVPSAPTGLVANAVSSAQINLSWTASSTAGVTYTIYGGTSAGASGLIAGGITGTTYSATGLSPSTTYFYTVVAVSSAGTSTASNQASAATQALQAPVAPTGLTATATSATQINLSWTASSSSGVSYSVYGGASSGSETTLVASGLMGMTYSATGLMASTTYFYTVKAVSGTTSSAASKEASATTQAAASGACHITYTDLTDWGAGFTGGISITNNGSTQINAWTLTYTYGGNQQIYQAWSSNYTQSGNAVTLTNAAWNGTIAPNSTITGIGFNANYSGTNGAPTAFSLNGLPCK